MASYAKRRIETREVNGVTVVTFVDRQILSAVTIQELGDELFDLVEKGGVTKLILDFGQVEFIASSALNKCVILERMIGANGKLRLCELKTEIMTTFVALLLNKLFEIRGTLAEALADFATAS